MATYRSIASTETDPQAPLTAALMKALDDNPTAITEGASGAPRILLPALERIVVGNTIKYRSDATFLKNVNHTTFELVPGSNIAFMQAGTIRVSGEHRRVVGNTSELRIRRTRGGSVTAIVTWSNSTSTFINETQDVAVQPGDILDLVIRNTTASQDVEARNIRYSASSATYLWPVDRYGYIENNATI